MNRFTILTTAWAAALLLGFLAIFTLGRPLPSDDQELQAALHPAPPVSQAVAEASAETIVRLQYGDLLDARRTVLRRSDFGVDRWVVTYTADGPALSGVTISVAIETGQVDVAAFP
ncbi:MAG: hypothetical protein FIA92_05350 [Chloroflexi bacterium]|nr:hypothetical protein [Chloroflexota bacterium]